MKWSSGGGAAFGAQIFVLHLSVLCERAASREALSENARREEVHPDALGSALQDLGFISQQKRLFDIPTTSGADSTWSSLPSDVTPLFFTKAQ